MKNKKKHKIVTSRVNLFTKKKSIALNINLIFIDILSMHKIFLSCYRFAFEFKKGLIYNII